MLAGHAENKGGGYHVEPAIEEMIGFMKRGAFAIASHMSELAEEILSYHRDEDYKIVRLRDDLISAMRYAFMMRRHHEPLALFIAEIEFCHGRGLGSFLVRRLNRAEILCTLANE
jgi:hypothetical protein